MTSATGQSKDGVTVITGASSGIGEAFARELGSRGHRLLLIARRPELLRQIADEIQGKHGVEAHVLPLDLFKPEACAMVVSFVHEHNWRVELLVNDAGVGKLGLPAHEFSQQQQLDMLHLNVEALVKLTYAFLPEMVAAKSGGIINIGSSAAFQPLPYGAMYAATKAFVHSFTLSIWGELLGSGVKVVDICPGPVKTNFGFLVGAVSSERSSEYWAFAESPEAVVRKSLRALKGNRGVRPTGPIGWLSAIVSYLLPGIALSWLIGSFLKGRVQKRRSREAVRTS